MKKACLALLLALTCLVSAGQAEKFRYQQTFLALFDTVTTIVGFDDSEEAFKETTGRIHDQMEEYDHLFDIYHEYPDLVNLCTINRHPGETMTVDSRIIDLLLFCQEAAEFSGGRTDITLGPVLSLWHEARLFGIDHPEEAFLPDLDALAEAREHTGFDKVAIDRENHTVCLLDPKASLDVGAVAKGYAAQRIAETLPEGYLLSVGGNVISSGPKPDGSLWTVGIEDPDGRAGYLYRIAIDQKAVVTSGDYQRYYVVDGTRYHHIIDPETLQPGEKWRSVTVVTSDSGLADAMSTTLFLMDQEEGQALMDQFGAVGMWIAKDGTQYFSEGFEAYIIP